MTPEFIKVDFVKVGQFLLCMFVSGLIYTHNLRISRKLINIDQSQHRVIFIMTMIGQYLAIRINAPLERIFFEQFIEINFGHS